MVTKRNGRSAAGYIEHPERNIEPLDPDARIPADGDADDDIPVIEPAEIGATSSDGDAPRKRGRPRGSTKPSTPKQEKQKAADLTDLLLSAHYMLAVIVKTPELELTEDEAKRLGKAVSKVNEEFGGIVMSPKAAAIAQLAMAAGSIYGPRFVAMRIGQPKEKKKAAAVEPITIDAVPQAAYSN